MKYFFLVEVDSGGIHTSCDDIHEQIEGYISGEHDDPRDGLHGGHCSIAVSELDEGMAYQVQQALDNRYK